MAPALSGVAVRALGGERRRRFLWGALVVAVLGLATAVQVLPQPSQLGSHFATNVGDPVLLMWQLDTQSHHPGSLLSANIFFPHTDVLAYSDPLIAYLPVFAPVLAVTGDNPIAAYNATAFALYLGGALAVYALGRHLLGRGDAALIGALLFTLAPYRSAAVAHVQLAGFLFVPLALLFLMRYLERRRPPDAALVGVCVGLTWLGTLYGAVMLAVALAAFVVVWAVQHRGALQRRLLAGLGVAAACAAVLVGPTLPAYVRVQRSGVIDRAASGLVTAKPDSFTHVPPSPLYRAAGQSNGLLADLQALFPGLVVLALAAVAAVIAFDRLTRRGAPIIPPSGSGEARIDAHAARRRAYALPLAAAALVCLAVMAGPNRNVVISEPDRIMRRLVPGMSNLRDLTRFWLVPLLVLALAAGLGALELLRRVSVRTGALLVAGVLVVAGLELGYRQEYATVALAGAPTDADQRLAASAPGPVIELPLPPVDTFAYDFTVNPRQLRSLIDGHPRVEGYSGAIPDDVRAAIEDARRLPDAAALLRLRRYGVRYLVLHGGSQACAGEYAPAELQVMKAALAAQTSSVAGIMQGGSDLIVELAPVPDGEVAPPAPSTPASDRGAPLCDLG